MRVLKRNLVFPVLLLLLALQAGFPSILFSQEVQKGTIIEDPSRPVIIGGEKSFLDPEHIMEMPDTNFSYEKYAEFLLKVSDTSKFLVLPIEEFRKTIDTGKIVIGLRHDVDNSLKAAYSFSQTEKKLGFRSTYYILHTADYYLARPEDKAVHNDSIIAVLTDMQNNSGFEIGWHNDLVTLQVVYGIDPVEFLRKELAWLRGNGLKITGSASHGSNYCRVYNYLNFYFFQECTWPIVGQFLNNVEIPDGTNRIILKKGKFSDFNLEYEAYFLNNNKYFSDASFINGQRWSIGMLDINSLKKGDRAIILLHPIHWHPGSTNAEIKSFAIAGQKSWSVNPSTSTIDIVMPYGTDLSSLTPVFSVSPGAYAKVLGSMQASGYSNVNFTRPVVYKVFAENRNVTKDWTVHVRNAKSNRASIESFRFPGHTKRVVIDPVMKTIHAKIYSTAFIGELAPEFTLSAGASAFVGSTPQLSSATSNDFSFPVTYRVVAEDGITASYWKVTAEFLNDRADIVQFVVPGMTKPAFIDDQFRNIEAEVSAGQNLTGIPALFQLSAFARAYVGDNEQISGLSVNDFRNTIVYNVISEDSLTISDWAVSVKHQSLAETKTPDDGPSFTVYPNPARGKAVFVLRNITERDSRIEMFNSQGIRVYSASFEYASFISEEIDLTGFAPGIYIIKCSSVKKPVRFIID
jgi:hypothetical protein